MRRLGTIAISLAVCILVGQVPSAQATSGIRNAWRTYYDPCTTLYNASCTICHPSTKALTYNPYGSALRTRIANQGMSNNAAFADAESIDSDGDGYTNGQEIIIDCTEPGVSSSHGVVADEVSTWGQIKAIYR